MVKLAWADVKTIGKMPTNTYTAFFSGFTTKTPDGKPLLSKAGEPKVKLEFTIDDETNSEYNGQKQWIEPSLQPQALWKLMNIMVALGWDEDKLKSDEGELEDQLKEVMSEHVVIDVELYEYNGKPQNRINEVKPYQPWRN